MKKERIMVLEMLENGKISADEAAKLLESLKGSRLDRWEEYCTDWEPEERLGNFANQVDGFAKEFSQKVEAAYKDMEPKLKKVSKAVAEKTVMIIDEISRTLSESIKRMDEEACECKGEQCESTEENGTCCNDDQPQPN